MYVEVDGWIVHGKYRESRAEEKKGKKKEACQPMFSESVYSPSRKPVARCKNDLIAVGWAHTNQDIDMWTLYLLREQAKFAEELHFLFISFSNFPSLPFGWIALPQMFDVL